MYLVQAETTNPTIHHMFIIENLTLEINLQFTTNKTDSEAASVTVHREKNILFGLIILPQTSHFQLL